MFSTIMYIIAGFTCSFVALSLLIAIEEKFFGSYPKRLPDSAKVLKKKADKSKVSRN
jgi:hypothetical protein